MINLNPPDRKKVHQTAKITAKENLLFLRKTNDKVFKSSKMQTAS